MRFMMLMIPKGYGEAKPDAMPKAEDIEQMMKYNESLVKAGVLLSGDGLYPPSVGTRVKFAGGKPQVIDGPFTESKELLGGYWMIQVKSRDEAVAWARKCPGADGDIIEVRQVHEMTDFPPEAQALAAKIKL